MNTQSVILMPKFDII